MTKATKNPQGMNLKAALGLIIAAIKASDERVSKIETFLGTTDESDLANILKALDLDQAEETLQEG